MLALESSYRVKVESTLLGIIRFPAPPIFARPLLLIASFSLSVISGSLTYFDYIEPRQQILSNVIMFNHFKYIRLNRDNQNFSKEKNASIRRVRLKKKTKPLTVFFKRKKKKKKNKNDASPF